MIKKTNDNFQKIVRMLGDGHYHTGEVIGETLQITRSAVWKAMKKLQSYGVSVDSIKGKGYALQEPLILLDGNKIKSYLTDKKIMLSLFESIESTNDYFKSIKPTKKIHVCLAEQQTKGKGRLGRAWFSPFAQNIYLSCSYPFQKDISELAGLSLVITLAVVNVLRQYGIAAVAKWPNDILIDGEKLSGAIIEVQAESHGMSHAIIGIGVNVNMLSDDREISQAWTSMRKLTGNYQDRNKLCADLMNELLVYLEKFNQQGFKAFIKEWIKVDHLTDQMVSIKNINEAVSGKVVGVSEQGHLLLKLRNGNVAAFSAGDASLVK